MLSACAIDVKQRNETNVFNLWVIYDFFTKQISLMLFFFEANSDEKKCLVAQNVVLKHHSIANRIL